MVGLKKKGCEKMYNKILVPVDGSELAECVLPHIENMVNDCGVKEIIFLRLAEPMAAAIAGDVEEELSGWTITVGPREAAHIPGFLKAR